MDLSRSAETQITALTDQNKPDEQDSCVGGAIAIVTIAFLGVYFSFRDRRVLNFTLPDKSAKTFSIFPQVSRLVCCLRPSLLNNFLLAAAGGVELVERSTKPSLAQNAAWGGLPRSRLEVPTSSSTSGSVTGWGSSSAIAGFGLLTGLSPADREGPAGPSELIVTES
nr:hypothetical protein Iba_chr14bCG7170 [Ipomoea batatas]